MAHYKFYAGDSQGLIREGDYVSDQKTWAQGQLLFGAHENNSSYVAIHNEETQFAWKITSSGIQPI